MIGNDEQLRMVIATESELEGIRRARKELVGLGDDAQTTGRKAGEGIRRMSPHIRTATHDISEMALMTARGGGNIEQMSFLSANAARSLAELSGSARVVASASGIGAIVMILGTGIALLQQFANEADNAKDAMDRIGKFINVAQAVREVRRLDEEMVRLQGEMENVSPFANPFDVSKLHGRFEEVVRQRAAAAEKLRELQTAADKKGASDKKKTDDEAERDAKARDDARIQSNARIAAARAAAEIAKIRSGGGTDEEREAEELRARELEIAAETNRQLEELARNSLLTTEQIEAERVAIIENANAQIGKIRTDAERKTQTAAQKAEQEAIAKKVAVFNSYATKFIQMQGSMKKALIWLALEPVSKELQGIAIREAVKAKAAIATGNFPGAALHGGAALAALMAARQVGQLAGNGESGGGGAASGGGGSTSTTFEPRSASGTASGSVVINLITQDPYGRENIQRVMYEVNRAGVLKVPAVEIPPTTAVRSAP